MAFTIEYPDIADKYYLSQWGNRTRIEDEPPEVEIANVQKALSRMVEAGLLPGVEYPLGKFAALRKAVRDHYEITWTSITPPMERLIYALNAIVKPQNTLCIGIFCGNTLTWNVGAAAGPGKCYDARRLVGVEIEEDPAQLARRNIVSIGMESDVEVLCADGMQVLNEVDYPIDLLYLDPNGYDAETGVQSTKRLYYTMVKKAYDKLSDRAVILAHDTIIPGFLEQAHEYLDFVRDKSNFRESVSVEIDEEGIEVTFK